MTKLLDTNVLVHTFNRASPHHAKASGLVEQGVRGREQLAITPQILFEFFAVVTSPRRVRHPLPAGEAARIAGELWRARRLIRLVPSSQLPSKVLRLAGPRRLHGPAIFDTVLAVTARENGLRIILTENVPDFAAFRFVRAVNPFAEG